MKPQFITIEGLEGAGKSSAIIYLKQLLTSIGITKVITTREPGGTHLGEAIRGWVKAHDKGERLMIKAELLLMYASRVQLVETLIKPALSVGSWVIADRFDLSTRAYQGGGRGIPDSVISQLYQLVLGDFVPDMTLYLDLNPSIGLKRLHSRGQLDRFEQEAVSFFHRARKKYLALAEQDARIFMVDASQPMVQVHQAIKQLLIECYPELAIRGC